MSEPVAPRFGDDGLITAVVQDAKSSEVLMVAHMNRAAWDATLAHPPGDLLQPIPATAVGEGGDERQHDASFARSGSTATVTPCSSAWTPPTAGVPHRRALLLLHPG